MARSCGANCARIILIVFNIIFWLSGAALIALGLYFIFEDDIALNLDFLSYVDDFTGGLDDSIVDYCAYAMIAVGTVVVLVGFCGCCGAIKESKCLLGMYIFFLTLIMLMEFAIGGMAIYYEEEIISQTSEAFPEIVTEGYANDSALRSVINKVQVEYECCGWNDIGDYVNVTYDSRTGIVPSCCLFQGVDNFTDWDSLSFSDVGEPCNADGGFHTTDCQEALKEWISMQAYILIGVGIGIACLELFGIIFACCLCRNLEA